MHQMQLLNPALLRIANPSATCLALFLCHWEMKFQFFTGIGGMYNRPNRSIDIGFTNAMGYCYVQVRTTSQKIVVHMPNVSLL